MNFSKKKWKLIFFTGEKPNEVIEAERFMLSQFQTVNPQLKGQITAEESARKCLQVIAKLDDKSSGLLLTHNGDQTNWV